MKVKIVSRGLGVRFFDADTGVELPLCVSSLRVECVGGKGPPIVRAQVEIESVELEMLAQLDPECAQRLRDWATKPISAAPTEGVPVRQLEKQHCARRAESGREVPGQLPDEWRVDRWGPPGSRRAIGQPYVQGGPSNVWDWPWEPRTCSFCGGVHPDDALKLVEAGWEVEGTDKFYKRYLEPPGTRACRDAAIAGAPASEQPRARSPVPPVKVYTPHFTVEQAKVFNAALRSAPR